MSEAARRYLSGLALFIGASLAIGWFYDKLLLGLLIGVSGALLYNVRHLVAFERALRNDDFSFFRNGDGIWQQFFSSYSFQKARAERYKASNRNLVREIRRSTNAMYDGAVVLDANNEIVMCNRAAKDLAGFKRKKDRGRRVDNILRAPELSELLKSGDFSRAIELRSPVHDDIWLHCRIAPYGGNQKLLFLRNVSERVRINKMRRDFVANASHELRSPLTVISGYIDAMSDDPELPEQWARPTKEMLAQTRRMDQLIKELLELSRLENEDEVSDQEIINMAALIRRLAEGYTDKLPVIEIEADTSIGLNGSPTEIESVVGNLLANAVRHTPADGKVSISWSANREGGHLCVADTGEGISSEHIPRLTERFFRVDRGRSRADGGIGLGLAIVKHALLRHDAKLNITSKLKHGSQFRCQFPLERTVKLNTTKDAVPSTAVS